MSNALVEILRAHGFSYAELADVERDGFLHIDRAAADRAQAGEDPALDAKIRSGLADDRLTFFVSDKGVGFEAA